ncbi:MAG: flagellar filament capping protein FliD [Planctomycetota bacterium]
MAITFTGLASGLDTDRLVTDLVRFSQKRIDVLKAREQVETSRQTAFQNIETRLQTLQTQAAKLGRAQGNVFDRKSVSTSDSMLVSAAAGSSAPTGVTSLRVLSLAQNHQVASQGFDDPNSLITQGTFEIRAGGNTTTITIDSSNNTVRGLAQAITNAGVGVTASVINDGSGSTTQPYRMLLSSNNTGTANAISITNNLAADGGGAFKPNFNSTHVGRAILGSGFTGTSAVASNSGAGNYTGTANDSFTFTVVGAGTVGTDNGIQIAYSNNSGTQTGTITVDQADVNVAKSVVDGVEVQFGAGTLGAGDTFTVDVFAPTIQSAANAQVQLGTGSGAVVVQSATNKVTDLIAGVTLDLQSADPAKEVQVTVSNDVAAARQEMVDFVKDYNDFMDYVGAQTRFDSSTGQKAILTGNRAVLNLRDQVQQSILSVSPNLPSSINRLGALGITSDGKGKLVVNDVKLDDALNGRVAGVGFGDLKKLFALSGTSSSSGIEFATGSRFTKESSTPYEIDITQAAERATVTATSALAASTVIDGTNNSLVVRIDETTSSTITLTSGTYSQLDLAREVEDRVNANLLSSGRQISMSLASQHLVMTSERYGAASEVSVLSGSSLAALGFSGTETDDGLDVAGSFIVNGLTEAATGTGQILKGNTGNVNTADLNVVVSLTSSQVQAGVDATLSITRGVASRFDGVLLDLLDPVTGRLQTIEDRFAQLIENAQQTTLKETRSLDDQKTSLLRQFAALEQAMNRIKQQGEYLTNAFNPSNSN